MNSSRNQVRMFSWEEKTAGSKYPISCLRLLEFHNSRTKTSLICCRYSTFVNWEFWWPNFPILVYFKESQTKPEGQIHFFPIIFVSSLDASIANTHIGDS